MKAVILAGLLSAWVLVADAAGQGAGAPTLTAMGFGDVVYVSTERPVRDGFLVGQIVGHVNAALTERVSLFAEVSVSARPAGFGVDAERLILRYDFSDALKLSLGRYHTPVSYWNAAFHHGLWLQTSVSRPEMIRFGGRLLPVHFVGVLAEGTLPVAPLGLRYAAGVGNGRDANIARPGDAGDVNDRPAWMASLASRPPALFGLQLGGGLYLDRVSPEEGPEVDERILSAHALRERETPEVLAEYSRILHEPVAGAGGRAASDALYLQLAYRLPGAASPLKPYARAEWIRIDGEDVLLAPLGLDYRAVIGGVRYDFAPLAALKAEYRNERFDAPERFHSLYLQASFGISGGGGASHPLAPHGAAPLPPLRGSKR